MTQAEQYWIKYLKAEDDLEEERAFDHLKEACEAEGISLSDAITELAERYPPSSVL